MKAVGVRLLTPSSNAKTITSRQVAVTAAYSDMYLLQAQVHAWSKLETVSFMMMREIVFNVRLDIS